MNSNLITEKFMTVSEISETLNVPISTIHDCINRILPGIKQNGKTTRLNEYQVFHISKELKKAHNTNLTGTRKVGYTDLEAEELIAIAMKLQQDKVEKLKEQLNTKTEQVLRLVHSGKLYTASEIAKELNMLSATKLNTLLRDKKIQYQVNGTWVLTTKYSNKGYTSIKQKENKVTNHIFYDRKWTGKGRNFLLKIFEKEKINEQIQ